MTRRLAALVTAASLGVACAGSPRRAPAPRATTSPTSQEDARDRALGAAETTARKSPRRVASWRSLRQAADTARQPNRYLMALRASWARGRLPAALHADLARRLRLQAHSLAALQAPAAAQKTLRLALRLSPAPAKQRDALARLADRLTLALADRALRTDEIGPAYTAYRSLGARGALIGAPLHWRLAAVGRRTDLPAVAAGLLKLGERAPAVSRRLAHHYLQGKGRDPAVLGVALRAASRTTDRRLVQRLDSQLSRVAPLAALEAACRLRRRPASPSCRQLQRWATTHLEALVRWAAVCRTLGFKLGDATWLGRALGLVSTGAYLGLGPLEDLVGQKLAHRISATGRPSLALLRVAGRRQALRLRLQQPDAAPTVSALVQRSFESWSAGLSVLAEGDLTRAAQSLSAPSKSVADVQQRCRLLHLTRLVRGPVAAHDLARIVTPRDPRLRTALVRGLRQRGALMAAWDLAAPAQRPPQTAQLRALGRRLAHWGLARDRTLLTHWTRRYGAKAAANAWRRVRTGIDLALREQEPGLARVTRLAAAGQLGPAEQHATRLLHRTRRRKAGLWRQLQQLRIWLAHLRRNPRAVSVRLRQLRHRDPGGYRALPLVLRTLHQLGQRKAAERLADALYEQTPTDPALLSLVARGAVSAGRYDKATLALTDWASQLGRPGEAYLVVARWLGQAGQHHRAAGLAARAIPWSGQRPLRATLATLGHQWSARRRAEARKTASWLLSRWPVGPARQGVSQALARALQSAGHPAVARRYFQGATELHLRQLLRKRRFHEVRLKATARARLFALHGHWHALAALGAQGQRRFKVAAHHVAQLARRAPWAEAPAQALLQAQRGRVRAALAWLALASLSSPRFAPELTWLAAALAARAGKRQLAARLASRAALRTWTDDKNRTLPRLRRLARGQRLPLEIPWAMLRTAPVGARSCAP